MKQFTLYSRPECHLCDTLQGELISLQSDHDFEFSVVNVDDDPELELKYGFYVPVLMLGQQKICHYHFDLKRFLSALAA